MKKRILLVISVLMVLGLTIAAFAYNKTNNENGAMDCCAKSDSCPMKNKNAQNAEAQAKDSCCDMPDCCCNGDSCPMKKQGENASANCCGDSCPMKDKTSETASTKMSGVTIVHGDSCCQPGADCCKGGACCKGKKG